MNTKTKSLKVEKIVPLNFDYMFHKIFNKDENIDLLENFLASYLEVPLNSLKGKVTFQPREVLVCPDSYEDIPIDLFVEINGEIINVQLLKLSSEEMIDMSVAFACHLHSKQLEEIDFDDDDIDIRRTLQIQFNSFHCCRNYIKESYFLMDEDGDILTNQLQIDVIDMLLGEKIYSTTDKENKLARWCKVLSAETSKDLEEALGNDLMEEGSKRKLLDEIYKYSADETVVNLYINHSSV